MLYENTMQLDQLGKVRIAGMCLSGCEVQWLILMVDVKKTGIYKIPLTIGVN